MEQHYFVDSTLLNSQLIVLNKFIINPIPEELGKNQDIRVKLYMDNDHIYCFNKCHIDDTEKRRLRLPDEIMFWIRETCAFSVAYYESHYSESKIGVWKKADIKNFYKCINHNMDKKTGKTIKMDIPGETILLSWEKDVKGSYLLIRKGFVITSENATQYLSKKAIASVLPYIFSTIKNTSIANTKTDGKKCYIIDRTTNWLSVKKYSETSFSHPGIYLLRRKTDNNEYAYYVGKAADIKNRIVKNGDKVSHPDEKDEDNKQYDDIACISIKFDDLMKLFGTLSDDNITSENNPGVRKGSDIDNALYAVEDIAIHVAAMILHSEGKILDNRQYKTYTSQWVRDIDK